MQILFIIIGWIAGYLFTSRKLTGEYFAFYGDYLGMDILFFIFWWVAFLFFFFKHIYEFIKDEW